MLGISPDEQDRAVIEEAALARAAEVRAYQITHPEECSRLLNAIADAVVTLLDPGRRAEHDAGLRHPPDTRKINSPDTGSRGGSSGRVPLPVVDLPLGDVALVVHPAGRNGACDVALICNPLRLESRPGPVPKKG